MNYPQATGPTATLAPPPCPTCTAQLHMWPHQRFSSAHAIHTPSVLELAHVPENLKGLHCYRSRYARFQ